MTTYPYYRYRRYRSAVRRYRRYGRYGRGQVTPLQKLIIVALLAVVAGGGGTAAVRHVFGHPGNKVAAAITYARNQIGKPYIWGGTGPQGYDCSGLVMEAYASAGVSIPRTSEAQWTGLHHVSSPHRGDLVFFAGADGTPSSPGHVGLVLGPHRMIQAYSTGFSIMVSSFGLPSSLQGLQDPVGYARPVPLVHRAVLVSAASSYTPSSWARAFLRGAGFPRTSCNLAAVTAWEAAEGGNWKNGAKRNPLDDTRWMPGSRLMPGHNPAHVRAYARWQDGLEASIATVNGPDYGAIRAALRAGNSAQGVAAAVAGSIWGTAPFTPASC